MVRPSALITGARGVARDPHARIHLLIALVFLVLAGAVLLMGGVQ
ncbi:hypothetical protein [Actinomadura formosensis]|nr:hypothetical protein [Actinomadura formosensis]